MICNKETKKELEKISGFVCDGIKYLKTGVIGTSVVKASCVSEDGKHGVLVRWERGHGWREAGTGRGGDKSKIYCPITTECSKSINDPETLRENRRMAVDDAVINGTY